MAFARTHALTDGELAVFWDYDKIRAKKVLLQQGEAYAPHFPSKNSEVIFAASNVHSLDNLDAQRQIAKWKAVYG